MGTAVPPCPNSLKGIQHYLTIAAEHDNRDVVVSYWCRLYALQQGLKIDKTSPEAKKLLFYLMDWLERVKSNEKENEAIVHDIAAQAHLENYALRLFMRADEQDRAGIFNKNVVKAFYTAGMLYAMLEMFGELTEEVASNQKYAKWKAAYIHNCLKTGETPLPGPMPSENDTQMGFTLPNAGPSSSGFPAPYPSNIPTDNSGPGYPPNIPADTSGSGYTANITPYPPPPGPSISGPNFGPGNALPAPPPPAPAQPFNIPPAVEESSSASTTISGVSLSPEMITKAQKLCKYASSALNYEDVATAVKNLREALELLTTGKE